MTLSLQLRNYEWELSSTIEILQWFLLGEESSLDYLVLKEAITRGLQVSENPKGERVPELYVTNNSGKKVLAIQGEYVVGGRQNRTFTRNVFFAEGFTGEIPVHCVEEGRWRYGRDSSDTFSSEGVVPHSLSHADTQGDTWLAADTYLDETTVHSETSDVGQTYRSRRDDFDIFKQQISSLEGQIGIIAAFMHRGKKLFVADFFNTSHSFQSYFPSLLESHALDSGLDARETISLAECEAKEFLDAIDICHFQKINSVSLGDEYTLHGDRSTKEKFVGEKLVGSVLLYEGNFLYTHLHNSFNNDQYTNPDTALMTELSQTVVD